MKRRIEQRFPAAEEQERCPVCGHEWADLGPAHFADCRYFCLDDDRDEDQAGLSRKHDLVHIPAPSTV
jgi:hypothetical protein